MDKNKLNKNPNKIVGRLREQKILRELVKSNKAEFIAVYGRRRIGKTYLIKHLFSSSPCVFFHVTGIRKGSLSEQLAEFRKQISNTFYSGTLIESKKNWFDAFEDLTKAIDIFHKDKKIILFFDELPWMVTHRSRLLVALELYWNRYWVFNNRIKLIICGSATSWIIENIINNEGGLHNRVTRSIQLKPFTLHETKLFMKERSINLKHKQILDLYMVLGGVPLYWSFISKGQSAQQGIEELCFQSDGALVNEFERLFDALFEDAKPYTDLIRIIAKHRYGIGQAELIVKAKLPDGGTTVKRLRQLEEAGFITSLVPYGRKDKGVYYLVDDEYSLFYLYWMEPNMKAISKKGISPGFWRSLSQGASWKSWSGYSFESICYKHITQIHRALKIDPGALASTWRYTPKVKKGAKSDATGAQIDLLFDRTDDSMTICEIKLSNKPFVIDKSYAKEIQNKLKVFVERTQIKKQLFFSMITTMGLKPTLYSEELVDSQVTLEDLFHE